MAPLLFLKEVSNKVPYKQGYTTAEASWVGGSHLAKRLSDLKQNGTHKKTPFTGTVFHTCSHDVLRFVASVSFKNH